MKRLTQRNAMILVFSSVFKYVQMLKKIIMKNSKSVRYFFCKGGVRFKIAFQNTGKKEAKKS